MINLNGSNRLVSRVLIWIATLALVAGCNTNIANAPSASNVTSEFTTVDRGFTNDVFSTNLRINVRGLVTPTLGGIVRLSSSSLTILPGAVNTSVLVTWELRVVTPPGLEGALKRVYEFGPDGTQFNIPAILRVSFLDAGLGVNDARQYRFYYWNGAAWEAQPTQVDMQNRQFIVQLNHFSAYAFGR
ncbi:MAG: hypothetical protein AAB393_03960 [Bacteroidota bacterium]